MSQEKFWVLFSKKLSGEASAEELKDLENLIQQHPEWQYSIQNLEDLWKHQPSRDFMHEEDAYLLHLHRMNELNISFGDKETIIPQIAAERKPAKWYWAAAAILIVATGLFALKARPGKTTEQKDIANAELNEVSTRPGSKSMVKLPDGSVVWLNAGSKITYDNKEFGKEIREVTLIGEGFFDVTKNKEKPFIIHTSSINIKVLGTAFNVKAYPEDKQTETSLIRGSIEVTIKNRPNDKIILAPSEKLIVENNRVLQKDKIKSGLGSAAPPLTIAPLVSINKLKYSAVDSTVAETQWINNKLVFRDETFADLAVRMERWFDISIEINDPVVKQARLNGIFETETIIQALEALKISIPFQYEKTGNKIIIHR
jgi:ferric-dicitrate binding protein FerR (iron transport regulator)